MDEQDCANVVEATEAELAQHLRGKRHEFLLMEFKPNLVDLFKNFALPVYGFRALLCVFCRATELESGLGPGIRNKAKICRADESWFQTQISPQEV